MWVETGFGSPVKTTAAPDRVVFFANLKFQVFKNAVIRTQ